LFSVFEFTLFCNLILAIVYSILILYLSSLCIQLYSPSQGNVDFKALLYLPSEVPYELTRDMFASSARSMRLYVKRVFINDKFEDLIPRWLLFLRGVVDSDDLPLNVGREILQQSRSLRIIKQRLVKKSMYVFH